MARRRVVRRAKTPVQKIRVVTHNQGFAPDPDSPKKNGFDRSRVLGEGLGYNKASMQYDESFVPTTKKDLSPNSVHTTPELVALLEQNKSIEIEGSFIEVKVKTREAKITKFKSREAFLKVFKESDARLKENDPFLSDGFGGGGNAVGDDFAPLMGGPFYKQLYQADYLRMIANCYYAYHHDPLAKATIDITTDFVLGRGLKVDCQNPAALALWDAFAKVNDFNNMIRNVCKESGIYGEVMIWKLPNFQTKITYQLSPGQEPPKGLIPRIRLIDPSAIWEIVTYPEDITRKLYYQYIAPTQYQTYTAPGIPTTKFIFQQIPADQVMHFKLNCVDNEKRGRSDLFAALGYLKRLRDSVNYSIVSMQKAAAWSIDTTVEGSQTDVDGYADAQQALGTIPPAGSEFVHTAKIKRLYLGNQASKAGGNSNAFDWCLSMVSAATRIPISYYGTHLSGGQTRASALVSTEPVAKLFESRQLFIEDIVKQLFEWLTGEECEVIFPEIISQDSTQKIKNLVIAEQSGFISKKRAATMTAKELNITDYDYETELKDIVPDQLASPDQTNPLTAQPKTLNPGSSEDPNKTRPSSISGTDKAKIKKSNGF